MSDKAAEKVRKPYFDNWRIVREVLSGGLRTHCAVACYLALALWSSVVGAVNQPDTERYDISIPTLNAAEAINRLAEQTGAILLFPYDLAKSRQANPTVGRYTLVDALNRLLQGSGLSSDLSDKGVIRISLDEETERNDKGRAMNTNEGKPKNTENKTSFIAAVSAVLLSVFTPVTTTAQEQSASTAGSVLEEIVVTATKSGETALQDTPLSITAFTAESMARSGVESIENLASLVPGLSISQNTVFGQLYIRGVGTNLVFPGSDASVTVHLDGVYLGRTGNVFADFVDLERVEVLRGPQGTLYGRNSAGGTINLVAKQPGDTVEGKLSAGYGAFDRIHFKGSFSGPLVEDKLYASISGIYAESDGYVKNIAVGGSDQVDEDTQGVRAVLRYLPWDNVEIQLSADYMEEDGTGPQSKQTGLLFDGTTSPGFPVIGPASVPADFHTINIPSGSPPSNAVNRNAREFSGISARVTVDINDNFSLSSLTATRGYEADLIADTDYSNVAELVSIISEEQNQLSEEIQLTGSFDKLNFVAGFYYFFEDDSLFGDINLPGPGLVVFGNPDFHSILDTNVETDAWALFTQGTYEVTEQITFTAGVRYSEEEKTIDDRLSLAIGTVELPGADAFTAKDKWTAWTPKFGLDYKWSDDILLYASVTRGFKSGGFNFSVNQSSFDPEFLWAYEAGIKSEWLDNRLRLNASGFYYDYTDLQVQQFVTTAGAAARVEITNAANAKVSGFELELNALPTPELELSAGIAYLDATYDSFITQRTGVPAVDINVSGNSLTASPDWSINLAGQYTVPLRDLGTASVRLEYQRMGDQFYTPFNDPVTGQSAYNLVNARLILTSLDEHWQMSVFGHNLTDEAYFNAIADFPATGVAQNITPPRTWGIDLSYRY